MNNILHFRLKIVQVVSIVSDIENSFMNSVKCMSCNMYVNNNMQSDE